MIKNLKEQSKSALSETEHCIFDQQLIFLCAIKIYSSTVFLLGVLVIVLINVAIIVKKIAELATILEANTGQQILDKKATEAVNSLSALGQMKSKKGIACVFEFNDRKYPLVADLDEGYFRCEQDRFVGQAYLLCKIIQKIPKGQNIKLDEIFDDITKLPLNRAQRRKMPKNMNNPAELRDVIKGPALVVLPIAVYQ